MDNRCIRMGYWMLMNNINPKEVYRIFMEWTIDAYEWVMIPNVFGMGQFSTNNFNHYNNKWRHQKNCKIKEENNVITLIKNKELDIEKIKEEKELIKLKIEFHKSKKKDTLYNFIIIIIFIIIYYYYYCIYFYFTSLLIVFTIIITSLDIEYEANFYYTR